MEKVFEKKLREKLDRFGGIAIKLTSATFTGLPDRMVLMPPGRIWFVELKSPGEKPSPRQRVVHALLRKLGFIVRVVDSTDTLNEFLNEVQPA